MAIKNFEPVGTGVMETGMAWFWSDKRIPHWTEVIGMEHIHDIRAQKRGILLIGLHFLTPEPGARQFGLQGPDIDAYRPNNDPLLDWLQTWGCMRSSRPMFDRKDLKRMIEVLKKGKVTWYALDCDYGLCASVSVPLFVVEQAATTSGTWMLSYMSNACLVPFIPRRESDGKGHQLIMLPPKCSPPLEDARTTVARINKIVE